MAKTKDVLKILDRRIGRNRTMRRLIEAERVNADIAQMIYDARTQAGLTQEELAKRVRLSLLRQSLTIQWEEKIECPSRPPRQRAWKLSSRVWLINGERVVLFCPRRRPWLLILPTRRSSSLVNP